jgi:hypothetical protein
MLHQLSDARVSLQCAVAGDDDATDDQCTIGTVPNILEGSILNHVS